ncbi:hypothetical protein [Gaopeijia maritima]|uniref:hypothetical protein n=1 Tax=Gaopeijia maritima TaxID=3119007 RepID=UPI00327816ED
MPLAETRFADAGVRERDDLQRLIRDQIEVLGTNATGEPDLLVLAEEFSDWEDSRRRVDLLAVDRDAKLVVIELKRTQDGGHMELQALRYAAMVSTLTWEKAVDLLHADLQRRGSDADAETIILEFLGWAEPNEDEFAQDVRIVLASAEFSRELTTAVMWLNERELDIQCVRLKPYRHGGRLLLSIEQVVPLPEATDYQVRLREKAREERKARSGRPEYEASLEFWQGLADYAATTGNSAPVPEPGAMHWRTVAMGVDGLKVTASWAAKNGTAHVYLLCRGDDPKAQAQALGRAAKALSDAARHPVHVAKEYAAFTLEAGGDPDVAYPWFLTVLGGLASLDWDRIMSG